jgi:hypothetical protein
MLPIRASWRRDAFRYQLAHVALTSRFHPAKFTHHVTEGRMQYLPKPVILECFEQDEPPLPLGTLRLQWDPNMLGAEERVWQLPRSITLTGPAPERFGLTVFRDDLDCYSVRLRWNDVSFHWSKLTRVQLLTTSLTPLLRALGQDLWQLLNQPISAVASHPRKAA